MRLGRSVNSVSRLHCHYDGQLRIRQHHGFELRSSSAGSFFINRCLSTSHQPPLIVQQTSLLCLYAHRGEIRRARALFDSMPIKNVVTWNAMLSAYATSGLLDLAREIFDKIPRRNVISWTAMLSGLLRGGRTQEANELFNMMPERNIISWNSMISGLARSDQISDARKMFDAMPERNSASWNAMITALSRNGDHTEAILVFLQMTHEFHPLPDTNILIAILHSCAHLQLLRLYQQVHAQAVARGVELGDSGWRMRQCLIQCYAHLGILDWAVRIFHQVHSSLFNTACWNSMIDGYSRAGRLDEALLWFNKTPCPDLITVTIMMSAYFDAGEVVAACKLFNEMVERDVVAWNAAISGLVQNEHFHEAIRVFSEMMVAGVQPLDRTFAVLLGAAGSAASLDMGHQLHSLAIRTRLELDVPAGNSLVAMYAKCGDIKSALRVFFAMPAKDVVSWNTVILGLSYHGLALDALGLYDEMPYKRDSITFLGALMACSQVGMVERGREIFGAIPVPGPEHYACMVHLLARIGQEEEAEELLELSSEVSVAAWGALVATCGDEKMAVAQRAARRVLELEPQNVPTRIKLCQQGKDEWPVGLKKTPAMSWVVIKGRTHAFHYGDSSHPDNRDLHALLGCGNLL